MFSDEVNRSVNQAAYERLFMPKNKLLNLFSIIFNTALVIIKITTIIITVTNNQILKTYMNPPKTQTERVTVIFPSWLRSAIIEIADERGITMSELIKDLCKREVEIQKNRKSK